MTLRQHFLWNISYFSTNISSFKTCTIIWKSFFQPLVCGHVRCNLIFHTLRWSQRPFIAHCIFITWSPACVFTNSFNGLYARSQMYLYSFLCYSKKFHLWKFHSPPASVIFPLEFAIENPCRLTFPECLDDPWHLGSVRLPDLCILCFLLDSISLQESKTLEEWLRDFQYHS